MRSVAVLLVLVATACSSSGSSYHPPCEGVAPDGQEACLTDFYFKDDSPPAPAALCPRFVPSSEKVGGRREVSFFLGVGMSDDDARQEGRSLQRFYRTYDLTFFTRAPTAGVPFQYALSGDDSEINAAVQKVGVKPGDQPTAEQKAAIDKAVADILFRDLRSFVTRESNPPKTLVNVVVLGEIASPEVAKQVNGIIGGLGISPRLLKNIAADDPQKDLFTILGLPEDFTPTLFVGHRDIVQYAQNRDVVVAHEMGHAMGLQHTQEPGNLMTQLQASNPCQAGLDDDQIAQLREAADVMMVSGWQMLLDVHRAVVERAISQH